MVVVDSWGLDGVLTGVGALVVEVGELDEEPQAAATTATAAIETARAPPRTLRRMVRR